MDFCRKGELGGGQSQSLTAAGDGSAKVMETS